MKTSLRFLFAACLGLISLAPALAATLLPQTITFPPPPGAIPFGVAPVALRATASSGLPITYTVISGPALISGDLLSVNGLGRVLIQAEQPGDATYAPARKVQRGTVAIKGDQRISLFAPIANQVFGTKPFPIILPTATSGLPVTVRVLSGPALIQGNIVTLTGVGSVRLSAQQGGDYRYQAADRVTTAFKVSATPVVTSLKQVQGTITKPFSYQITSTGAPGSFTVTGTLPPGLAFDAGQGILSGIPQKTGFFNLVIGATSAQGTGTANLRIHIVDNVPHLYVANYSTGTIGEYTTAGKVVNAALIKGLEGPVALAVADGFIYVSTGNGIIGKYTTSGDVVNAKLVSGLPAGPGYLAVSGSQLFGSINYLGTVAAFTTSGETINTALISGLHQPTGIAATASALFIPNLTTNNVAQYTLSGTRIAASIVRNLARPTGIAVTDTNIYVLNNDIGTIGKYTLAGKPVAVTLASGLDEPYDIEAWGETLYVTNSGTNSIAAYSTSGTVINPYLIVGLHMPCGVALGMP